MHKLLEKHESAAATTPREVSSYLTEHLDTEITNADATCAVLSGLVTQQRGITADDRMLVSPTEMEMREDLILPQSGELISLDDPDKVASALTEIRELESRFREVKAILTRALVAESQRQGSRTLHLDEIQVEVRGGSETIFDAQTLEDGLRAAGCPEETITRIIKIEVSYSVVAGEAKRAAGANPEYEKIIQSCKTVVEKPPYVSIRKPSARGGIIPETLNDPVGTPGLIQPSPLAGEN